MYTGQPWVTPCAWGVSARVSNLCLSRTRDSPDATRRGVLSREFRRTLMEASHSEWSVYVVSGYLWGAGTIRGAGFTAIPAIYPTNWTRKLAKMRANGVIEFPLFVLGLLSFRIFVLSLTFSKRSMVVYLSTVLNQCPTRLRKLTKKKN